MKTLIAAGGSGGHLFPAQELAMRLQGDCMIAGYKLSESAFFARGKIPFQEIASSPLSIRRPFFFLRQMLRGFFQAIALIRKFSPDVVVGFGSYHAFPVLLAAAFLRKKIILFEANCSLGKVNRFFVPFAAHVAVQFPQKKFLKKQVFVAPRKIKEASREEAKAYFGFTEERPTLLVFGGSQGASFFNRVVPQVAERFPNWQIIHLTGKGLIARAGKNVCVKEFETQMHLAYLAADFVMCRSGASTIAELMQFDKPALLIPFPHASENHQWENGEFLSRNVLGVRLLAEKEATVDRICDELQALSQRQEAIRAWKGEDVVDFAALIQGKYHLIGIGGIGMSALARILLQKGCLVQGSDLTETPLIQDLRKQGAKVRIGHSADGMEGATVVYSTDVGENNVEMMYARKHNLKVLHRSDLLDVLAQEQKPLLITGTHGKTTTTALLAEVLLAAGKDPSFIVGGILQSKQTNGGFGKGEYFVAEADESDGSFLKTRSFGAIVTNCDNDHLNYWKTEENLQKGFRQFFAQVTDPEHLFWCRDDARLCQMRPSGTSYGFSEDADFPISRYRPTEKGIVFDVGPYKEIELALRGKHNAQNGAAVFALALSLQVDEPCIRKAFLAFRGTKRRLEFKGESKGVSVFDDYGHHPTEIAVTLKALREQIGTRRLVCVFQPHRFSRTEEQLEFFADCFSDADEVILTDIYSAGESPISGISSEILYEKMRAKIGKKLTWVARKVLEEGASQMLRPQDVVLTIGAGDVTKAGLPILQKYEEGHGK